MIDYSMAKTLNYYTTAAFILRLAVLLLVFRCIGADRLSAATDSNTIQCKYTTTKGDTLSELLFKSGIDGKTTNYFLYGKKGWVLKNKKLNPTVQDWTQLPSGLKIKLVIPKDAGGCPGELKPPQPEQDGATSIQEDLIEPLDQVESPAEPDSATTAMPEIVQETAPQDKENQNMLGDFFDGVKSAALTRVEIVKYRSLASNDLILLPKLSPWAIKAETKVAKLDKLRFSLEYQPIVTESFESDDYSVSSVRVQFSKGFGFEMPWKLDGEVAPKIGYWKYSARLPILIGESSVKPSDLSFDRQLDFGFDLSVSRSFGLVSGRVTHGRNLTLGLKGTNDDTARGQSYRTNLELAIQGPSFKLWGLFSRTTFSAHLMSEANRISIGDSSNSKELLGIFTTADLGDTRNESEIASKVNYAGLGLGIIW